MHYCAGSQCGHMSALCTTPALTALVPVLMLAATFTANNTLGDAYLIEILLTGLFVWKPLGKFD